MGRGTTQRKFSHVALPGMGRGNHKVVKGNLKSGSAFKNSNASTKVGRSSDPSKDSVKAGGQQRSKNTLKRLEMYRQKAPNKRDLHKQLLKPQRIEPDRRWFGNTRVITQTKMQDFREEMAKEVNDPYRVVLKSSKLPLSLLTDSLKNDKMDLLRVESFADTFGAKKQRKRPKLVSDTLEQLVSKVGEEHTRYEECAGNDKQLKFNLKSGFEDQKFFEGHDQEEIFLKGTSRRIWRELYKVVDSSDVLIQVLDARDPEGTRCRHLERNIAKNHPHKHVVLLLNKCDLIPNWATRRWCEILRKEKPTLAFHASVTNPFGKSALIQLLRQFAKLIKDKKQIQVGLIGYPNVGKSSVINTLKKKEVCKSAPVPGETKVWQYIALTKKIYAIDCPGIVPLTSVDFAEDTAKVLKGVVRAEKLEAPSAYIDEVVSRVKAKYLRAKYNLPDTLTWTDGEDFLQKLAMKMGKLRKGGEPDLEITARIVLYDWQRGRIPYFVAPPMKDGSAPPVDADEDEKVDAEVAAALRSVQEKIAEDAGIAKTDESKVAAEVDADKNINSNRKSSDDKTSQADARSTEAGEDQEAAKKSTDATRTGEEEQKNANPRTSPAENKTSTEDAGKTTAEDAVPTAAEDDEDNGNSDAADDSENEDSDAGDGNEIKDVKDIQASATNDFSGLNCSMPFDDEDLQQGEINGSKKQKRKTIQKRKQKREIEKALAMNSDDSDVDPEEYYQARKDAKRRKKKQSKASAAASRRTASSTRGTEQSDDEAVEEVKAESGDKKSITKGKKSMKKAANSGLMQKSPEKASMLNWDKALEEFA
ncbi:unnamed protein product [Amoebophrya sp. A120]|nr:unnamed protein product [Amoebophrya sp. A120]|eukprot:GSA120T00002661001.1